MSLVKLKRRKLPRRLPRKFPRKLPKRKAYILSQQEQNEAHVVHNNTEFLQEALNRLGPQITPGKVELVLPETKPNH